MTMSETNVLVDVLKYACNYHRFSEPGVVEQYTKALIRMDFKRASLAIDTILKGDSRNVPAISEILSVYANTGIAAYGNIEYCPYCDDKGIIFVKESFGEQKHIYEMLYYCPYCAMGEQYTYDGSTCKEKSPYRVHPITEVFCDEILNQIKTTNLSRKEKNKEKRKKHGNRNAYDKSRVLSFNLQNVFRM